MSEEAAPIPNADNPFLQGNFGPVAEERTVETLRVRGALPPELEGMLLRDGPNPIDPQPGHHWFVGDAMIHAVRIAGGKASGYRNRYVRTEHVQEVLGLPAPAPSPLQPPLQGSGNVNVVSHAGRILALSEVGLPYELDRDLNTLGQYDFGGTFGTNMTAHPKFDPANGEMVFFGYDVGEVCLRYHVADASGAIVHSVDIDKPAPTMMHDFGVTATRVVHMDLPVVFDLAMVEAGSRLPFRWSDEHQARLGVMPRRGQSADVNWIDIDPCYVFHPLNSYDDGEQIVMDVVRYDRTFVQGAVTLGDDRGKLVRWTIDPTAGKVDSQLIDPSTQDFPRVSPRVECHRHRYGYALGVAEDPNRGFDGLIKHDLQAGTRSVHRMQGGRSAGEGVFVPVGSGEDEGYLLSVVYDPDSQRSEVIVIDATRFEAPPVAVIELPCRVPYGFHGNWV